jgi:hypothetical protein
MQSKEKMVVMQMVFYYVQVQPRPERRVGLLTWSPVGPGALQVPTRSEGLWELSSKQLITISSCHIVEIPKQGETGPAIGPHEGAWRNLLRASILASSISECCASLSWCRRCSTRPLAGSIQADYAHQETGAGAGNAEIEQVLVITDTIVTLALREW